MTNIALQTPEATVCPPPKTAPAADEEDRLDWDSAIEKPPCRAVGSLHVRLEYAGRSKPIPIPDPEQETAQTR